MENEGASTPYEKPKTQPAWRTMCFSLAAIVVSALALVIFNSALRSTIDEAFNNENAGGTVGLIVGLLALVLSLFALVAGIRAFKKGERSLMLWVGLIPAIVMCAFWIVMLVGELLFFE